MWKKYGLFEDNIRAVPLERLDRTSKGHIWHRQTVHGTSNMKHPIYTAEGTKSQLQWLSRCSKDTVKMSCLKHAFCIKFLSLQLQSGLI